MIYPTNIKVEKKGNFQTLKEIFQNIINEIITKIRYLIFDRTNIGQIIIVKLHI